MALAVRNMGNNATACRASMVSTGSDTLRSKPTRSRDEPISTVPLGVLSTTGEVCRPASELKTLATYSPA